MMAVKKQQVSGLTPPLPFCQQSLSANNKQTTLMIIRLNYLNLIVFMLSATAE